jgi:hypothetical protein
MQAGFVPRGLRVSAGGFGRQLTAARLVSGARRGRQWQQHGFADKARRDDRAWPEFTRWHFMTAADAETSSGDGVKPRAVIGPRIRRS